MSKPEIHWIVTPDIIGPVKNGGIGTHAYWLGKTLSAAGKIVKILFTGPFEEGDQRSWAEHYAKEGMSFVSLFDIPIINEIVPGDWFNINSLRIHNFLSSQEASHIHFQDWQANGFHTIQAKRTLGAYTDVIITVTLHSPSEWIIEGMQRWAEWPITDAKQQYCERYCCENCDMLISPSEHMFYWAEMRGWSLQKNRLVIPYCLSPDSEQVDPLYKNHETWAFFGRLETRKGLELFLSALKILKLNRSFKIPKIIFLGKNGSVSGSDGVSLIKAELDGVVSDYEIISNLNSNEALECLKKHKALAIAPSLLDNFPFSILECISSGIPVIAACTGGIPEILGDEQLFEPNARCLAQKLEKIGLNGLPFTRPKYNPAHARFSWQNLQITTYQKYHSKGQAKKVSICVPYFNYGKYIETLIESLKNSTYTNFEVIIVDDGSSDDQSIKKFDYLSQSECDKRFLFFRKLNGGVGEARNYAAQKSTGDYLIFMDADNVATSEMISKFVSAIEISESDVLTCHFKAFDAKISAPNDKTQIKYIYAPIGPALGIGWAENVFGDANFIIKRRVFEEIGGFKTDRSTSWEDWDLLARLALAGFRQDVIPETLFWYRFTPEGFSRNTNVVRNQRRVLQAYLDYGPPYIREMLINVSMPYHVRFGEVFCQLEKTQQELSKAHQILTNIRPFWPIINVLRKCMPKGLKDSLKKRLSYSGNRGG